MTEPQEEFIEQKSRPSRPANPQESGPGRKTKENQKPKE